MIARRWAIESAAVDRDPQVRSVVEPFRVPRAQRAQLVDDPALVAARRRVARRHRLARARRAGSPRPRRRRSCEQQIDVVEQELAALLERDRRAAARPGRQIGGLREDPRIAQHAAPDEHAADAASRSRSTICSGSTQSPLPNTGMRQPAATRAIELPVGRRRCTTAPPCGRARRPPRRRHPPPRRASSGALIARVVPARRAS